MQLHPRRLRCEHGKDLASWHVAPAHGFEQLAGGGSCRLQICGVSEAPSAAMSFEPSPLTQRAHHFLDGAMLVQVVPASRDIQISPPVEVEQDAASVMPSLLEPMSCHHF